MIRWLMMLILVGACVVEQPVERCHFGKLLTCDDAANSDGD